MGNNDMMYNKWKAAMLIAAVFSIIFIGALMQVSSLNQNSSKPANKAVYLFDSAPSTVIVNSFASTYPAITNGSINSSSNANNSNATVNNLLKINKTKILYPGTESTGTPTFGIGQVVTDTDAGAYGGIAPYTYEWFVAMPNSITYNPANCGAGATGIISNPNPCEYTTNTSSPLGQYHFKLRVTDSSNSPHSVNSSPEPFNLDGSLNIISLTANRTTVSGNQLVDFSNETVNGTGGRVFSYTIISIISRYQGGTIINKGHNKFGFTVPGTYNIALNVKDKSGESSMTNITIQVNNPVETKLFENRSLISAGQWISFTNKTKQGTGSYQYSYIFSSTCRAVRNASNGNTWQFNNATTCTVNLNVKDATGATNSSSNTITIDPKLKMVSLTPNASTISANQTVSFANLTTGGTGSNVYSYSVGCTSGGSNSINVGNAITFTHSGTCTVTLHVADLSGEISSKSTPIKITK